MASESCTIPDRRDRITHRCDQSLLSRKLLCLTRSFTRSCNEHSEPFSFSQFMSYEGVCLMSTEVLCLIIRSEKLYPFCVKIYGRADSSSTYDPIDQVVGKNVHLLIEMLTFRSVPFCVPNRNGFLIKKRSVLVSRILEKFQTRTRTRSETERGRLYLLISPLATFFFPSLFPLTSHHPNRVQIYILFFTSEQYGKALQGKSNA